MTNNPLIGTLWRVVKGIEYSPELAVTIEFTQNSISGFSGCNNYRAQYKVDEKRLHLLTPPATTLKMCPEKEMATETAFLDCLAKVAAFHLEDNQLELANKDGKLLLTLHRIGITDLFGTWQVVNVHMPERKAVVSVDEKLQMIIAEGLLRICSGTNTFCGQWSAKGLEFSISRLNIMSKEGRENTLRPIEESLLLALKSVSLWKLAGRKLFLLRRDGGIEVSLIRSNENH